MEKTKAESHINFTVLRFTGVWKYIFCYTVFKGRLHTLWRELYDSGRVLVFTPSLMYQLKLTVVLGTETEIYATPFIAAIPIFHNSPLSYNLI